MRSRREIEGGAAREISAAPWLRAMKSRHQVETPRVAGVHAATIRAFQNPDTPGLPESPAFLLPNDLEPCQAKRDFLDIHA